MKKLFFLSVVAGLFFAACGSQSGEATTAAEDTAAKAAAVDTNQSVSVDTNAAETVAH